MTIGEQQRLSQERFGHVDGIELRNRAAGLPTVELSNRYGTGRIQLQGAQLLEWRPTRQAPVLWISQNAQFMAGKSPRGGVPVCWPWFGPHGTNPSFPAHGFARTAQWELVEAVHLENSAHHLTFSLIREPASLAFWPHSTPLTLTYTLGESVDIELLCRNDDPQPITISEALHTYFAVGDVRQVCIQGLDGCDYIDKVEQGRRRLQTGDITFSGETDRVYQNTTATCLIVDPILNRRIRIEKAGSRSTVVWNPWTEKAAKLGDFSANGYMNMVCVESGNVADDQITLAPGKDHRLWVSYSWDSLR